VAVYRPSAVVRLQLRLDDGGDADAIPRQAPDGSTPNDTIPATESGRAAMLDALSTVQRLVAQSRALLPRSEFDERMRRVADQRGRLQRSEEAPERRPDAVDAITDEGLLILGGISPVRARIERNSIRTPDECEITLDFRDAPLDPRVIRAAFVELVIGVVPPDDFERGIRGGKRPNGTSYAQIDPESPLGSRFVGFVDDWQVNHADDGDVVVLKAVDPTVLLTTRQITAADAIDLTLPVADGVQALVNRFVSSRGMEVIYGSPPNGSGSRGPTPADAIPAQRKARRGKVSKRALAGGEMSAWDHISDVVGAVGLVPLMVGWKLFLMQPRTFFARTDNAKRLVYGRNLEDLRFARKIGGVKVPTVEVRSSDPVQGRTLWARWPVKAGLRDSGVYGETNPPPATRGSNVTPSGQASDEIRQFRVQGIGDLPTLREAARSIFEQIGRQEIEGSFKTSDLTSFQGDELDLLNLTTGDAVELLIAPLNAASNGDSLGGSPDGSPSNLQELHSMSVARRQQFLQRVGWSPGAAARMAEVQEQTALNTIFRVSEVSLDFSADEGVAIEGSFVNFLVAREAPEDGKQAPSDAAQNLTRGQVGLGADVRAQSAAGATLGSQARGATLAPDQYASDAAALREAQTRNTQQFRRGTP
jgi:hypothetical protein